MSEDLVVRLAELSDAEELFYINKTDLGYDYDLEKQKQKLGKILSDKTQALFVAVINNKVVGYIHLADYDLIYADNMKNCLGLAVRKNYRRMGIGSSLLKKGELWAKENGASGVRINSGIEREAAHRFYISEGYDEKKLQKNFIKYFQ